MRAAQKNHGQECPARILPLEASGKRNAAAALGLVASLTNARARSCSRRLVPSSRVTSGPILGALALRTMIVP